MAQQDDGSALDSTISGADDSSRSSSPRQGKPGDASTFAAGDLVAGRYRVVELLARGGMGFRKVSLLTESTRALVAAMTRSGVRRLVCISAPRGRGQPRPRWLRVRPALPAFAAQPGL